MAYSPPPPCPLLPLWTSTSYCHTSTQCPVIRYQCARQEDTVASTQATCASLTSELDRLRSENYDFEEHNAERLSELETLRFEYSQASSQLSKERGAQCTDCNKWFNCASDLAVHRRTHTGEKPYECGVCSKSFRTSSQVVCHRRIHSGQKPYKCHVCDQAFSQSGHKNRHIARIHAESHCDKGTWKYVCSECKKHLHTAEDFKLHFALHLILWLNNFALIDCFAFVCFLWYGFFPRQEFSTIFDPCTSSVIYRNNFSIS